jgi:glyoxylase-like metal-dependent hydrolase (beta-lactamase superfamily II)
VAVQGICAKLLETCIAIVIDPDIHEIERYLGIAAQHGLRIRYLLDTHTPGHTADSICVQVQDRVFTGDTLLIGSTGRTDLPSGNATHRQPYYYREDNWNCG